MIFLRCNNVILPQTITSLLLVSVSASCPFSWTETLPLQHSECLQHRAHETADEAALSRCAARMRSVRCVLTHLKHKLWPLPSISCCVSYLPGQTPSCRRRCGDHQRGENSRFTKDAEKNVEARAKPQGQRRSSSGSSTANSDVILPKIVNTWLYDSKRLYCFKRVFLLVNTCFITVMAEI